jgi:hypothetical protein
MEIDGPTVCKLIFDMDAFLTHSHTPDGPGKWLLDPRIQAHLDIMSLVVRFSVEYDGGCWVTRTAKTVKNWFITEEVLKDEVVLELTDQRGKAINKTVSVRYLQPTAPKVNHPAMIIDGEKMGHVGMINNRHRKSGNFVIVVGENSLRVAERDLCRLAMSD